VIEYKQGGIFAQEIDNKFTMLYDEEKIILTRSVYMGNILNASVELIGGRMKFRGVAGGNPEIITDYIPPMGDGEGYMPLELFLVSLSSRRRCGHADTQNAQEP
jgi:hypothetical protein